MEQVNDILNKKVLSIDGVIVKVREAEYYFDPDPYIHGDDEQLKNGTWYLHRTSTGKFRSGTYKGIDYTCGNGTQHGGILIRGIETDDEIIEGPCNVVDYIMEIFACDDVEELDSVINTDNLKFVDCAERKDPIYYGPRGGLGFRYPRWFGKPFRACTYIPKKYRVQFVLGLYYHHKMDIISIKELCGKRCPVKKYISMVQDGDSTKSNQQVCETYYRFLN